MSPWERARRYAEKPERLLVGLMSGTSVDGVDAALVRISGSARETRVALEAFVLHPFPPELRRQVLDVSHGEGNAETVSRLNFALGALFAEAARAVIDAMGVVPADVDLVASHGQTVSHTVEAPPAPNNGGARGSESGSPIIGGGGGLSSTLQIGEPAVIAGRLGVPVVSDFRVADVAAGGQGAPLVPYADWCLLTHPTKTRAIQNIGGIGNVTYLPADAQSEEVIGFDTGPGNMLIDRAAAWVTDGQPTFDKDGALAAQGRCCEPFLAWLREHPFLKKQPPKSAGREEFGEAFFNSALAEAQRQQCSGVDVVTTMTAFTASSIADAYERFLPAIPEEVIIGGGGSRNPTLMALLSKALPTMRVMSHEEVGINSDAKEAIAFVVLANETMLGRPSNLPSVTGASRRVILGKLSLP